MHRICPPMMPHLRALGGPSWKILNMRVYSRENLAIHLQWPDEKQQDFPTVPSAAVCTRIPPNTHSTMTMSTEYHTLTHSAICTRARVSMSYFRLCPVVSIYTFNTNLAQINGIYFIHPYRALFLKLVAIRSFADLSLSAIMGGNSRFPARMPYNYIGVPL